MTRINRAEFVAFTSGVPLLAFNTLVAWPLIGHHADTDDIALLATILANAAILAPIVSCGLPAAELAASNPIKRANVSWLLRFHTAIVALAAAASTLALLWVHYGLLLLGLASMMGISLVANTHLRVTHSPARFVGVNACSQSLSLAGAGLVLARGGSPSVAVVTYVLIGLMGSLAFSRLNTANAIPPTRRRLRAIASIGLLSVLSNLTFVLIPQGARSGVGLVGTDIEIITFQYATLVALGILTIQNAVANHLGILIIEASESQRREALRAGSRRLAQLGVLLAVFGVAFAVAAPGVWLPDSVDVPSWQWTIMLLLPGVMAYAFSELRGFVLFAQGRFRLSLLYSFGAVFAGAVTFGALLRWLPPPQLAACAVTIAALSRALFFTWSTRESSDAPSRGRRVRVLMESRPDSS